MPLAPRGAGRQAVVPDLEHPAVVPILVHFHYRLFFMSLAPERVLGAEFASIFAIFTSQA